MFKKREKPLLSMEEICEMNNISYGDSVEEDALDLSEIGNIFDNNSEFLLFDRRYSAHNFNSISFSYSESDNRKIISSEKSIKYIYANRISNFNGNITGKLDFSYNSTILNKNDINCLVTSSVA